MDRPSTVCVDITNMPTDQIRELTNMMHDAADQQIQQIATDLSIPEEWATDVWYLRTRSRWTPELENQLIQLHREGKAPNMCEFPN